MVTGGPRLAVGVTVKTGVRLAAGIGRVEAERATVRVPSMTMAAAAGVALEARERERGVPETVMGAAPGMRVWEPITNWEAELAVRMVGGLPLEGEKVNRRAAASGPAAEEEVTIGAGRAMVLEPPTTTAEAAGASDMGVPAMVMAGPPGTSVWSPITNEEAWFSDRVAPPAGRVTGGTSVKAPPPLEGRADGGGSGWVLEPMTIAVADGARETGVLLMVTGGPPGAIVVLPIPNADVPEPIGVRATPGRTTVEAGGGGARGDTTKFVPADGRDITESDTVTGGPPGVKVELSGPMTTGVGCGTTV